MIPWMGSNEWLRLSSSSWTKQASREPQSDVRARGWFVLALDDYRGTLTLLLACGPCPHASGGPRNGTQPETRRTANVILRSWALICP